MEQKPTVSVLGACVSRDIFGIARPDTYIVEKCISLISPMSMMQSPPENGRILDKGDFVDSISPAFYIRNLCLDINKTVFDFLKEKQSEWLVLDIADARLPLTTFTKNKAVISRSGAYLRDGNFKILFQMFGKERTQKACQDFSYVEWEACIDWFLQEVLKQYRPEQIIFHEYYSVYDYISKENKIVPFAASDIRERKKQNAVLQNLNRMVEERLSGCHIIHMPENTIANELHKWGKMPMHYADIYYEYAGRAIDVITSGKPLAQERAELSLLKDLYTQKFTVLRQSYQLKEKKPLFGKTAIVTGGSGEIGSACCLRLAQDGAKVAVCGRNKEKLQAVVDTIRSAGGRAEVYAFDVTDVQAIHENFKSIYDTFGSIDILVNNAGASERNRSKYLYNQSPEVIDEMLILNLRAAMLCTRKAFQFMVKKDGSPEYGKVINIASVVGIQGRIRLSSYSAAKSGLLGFTKSVALEMGHHNITVNCVSPGIIVRGKVTGKNKEAIEKTNCMHVVPPTESISSAVAFLVSHEADMITGQNLIVDAGRSLGLIGG